nr:immunoglobulin heavy chain junction region [Mus musculus]
CSRGWYYFDYW